jgi:hypothetical protein
MRCLRWLLGGSHAFGVEPERTGGRTRSSKREQDRNKRAPAGFASVPRRDIRGDGCGTLTT